MEAQESNHEGLRLSVTGPLKEDGEPSQLQELLLDAQVTFTFDRHLHLRHRISMSLLDELVLQGGDEAEHGALSA